MNGQVSDNDFDRGHEGGAGFDPSNPTTNAVLSYLFNRNEVDNFIVYNSTPVFYGDTLNICWIRDAHVEQQSWAETGITLYNQDQMQYLERLYTEGDSAAASILAELNIPAGTTVRCLHCGGSGQIMNPSTGTLQSDPACGGDGTVEY